MARKLSKESRGKRGPKRKEIKDEDFRPGGRLSTITTFKPNGSESMAVAPESAVGGWQALLQEEINEHDPGLDAEYCWWCGNDINGKNGPKMHHDQNCWRVRAEALMAALLPLQDQDDK